MGSCIARQPIFNKNLNIYGYELLYRKTADSDRYDSADGDKASSETIMNSFHEIGIERVTGGKRAFVNFTEKLLLGGVATILPNKILIIEILENIRPTADVLDACKRLRSRGYTIALDDFVLEPDFLPLIAVSDIIKVDFISTPIDKINMLAKSLKDKPIRLLAEKLETKDDYDQAVGMGFSLFQGYFFSKPVLVTSHDDNLTPIKVNCLHLIRLANELNVNFSKIAEIIKRDVALSYRLLRVINSAFFGLRYTVKNIKQALAILGMDEVKKWITLISLAELSDGKPDELVRMSLLRAKFLELIAPAAGMARSADDLFMLGLMSLMDAIMDMPMEQIVKQTNISQSIASSLTTGQGPYGRLLQLVTLYERSHWDEAIELAASFSISPDLLFDTFLQAMEWSNKM